MTTRKELKQRVEELDSQLVEAWLERDALKAEIEALKANIARGKESEGRYYHWYHDEQSRAQFYFRCLSKIRHILALDTVEQLTHRGRNEKLRTLIITIALWMNTTDYSNMETDDIPF